MDTEEKWQVDSTLTISRQTNGSSSMEVFALDAWLPLDTAIVRRFGDVGGNTDCFLTTQQTNSPVLNSYTIDDM